MDINQRVKDLDSGVSTRHGISSYLTVRREGEETRLCCYRDVVN